MIIDKVHLSRYAKFPVSQDEICGDISLGHYDRSFWSQKLSDGDKFYVGGLSLEDAISSEREKHGGKSVQL